METNSLYVTRDKYGELYLSISESKPEKTNRNVWDIGLSWIKLPEDAFPNVKWEDKEPLEVTLMQKVYRYPK